MDVMLQPARDSWVARLGCTTQSFLYSVLEAFYFRYIV